MTQIVSMNLGQMFKVNLLDSLTLIVIAILVAIANCLSNMQSIARKEKNKMENLIEEFQNAIQIDHLTKDELDLVAEIFKDFK